MQETVAVAAAGQTNQRSRITSVVRAATPTLTEWAAAIASAVLLILAFPNFEYSFLAWVGFVPLLLVIARRPSPARSFFLGWATGTLFFYASCYWLTYSMIHYGGLSSWLAYSLLLPGALVVGLFPALFALTTSGACRRWGPKALLLTPVFWSTFEWIRLGVTGQLWNAIGYSQAEVLEGLLILPARWSGVYGVGFLIVSVNAAIAFMILKRTLRSTLIALAIILGVGLITFGSLVLGRDEQSGVSPNLHVIAIQPNVPMTAVKTVDETRELLERHLLLSANGLKALPQDNLPRLVVWPESPMNFTYAGDKSFQDLVAKFTRENRTSLIFNALEPAPNEGGYNSALLINEEGRLIAQYDKIRLMPFGEYVPLPQWLGGSLISAIVGDFTPGDKYTLMPVGSHRAGVFICIESAYPWIAQRLTREGADVLINISNDGYLGPTAVMKQHLANTIFRAVENGRPLLRVTNTGLSAWIGPTGGVLDRTSGFEADVRSWTLFNAQHPETFYSKHGDRFVQLCTLITILISAVALYTRRRSFTD
jgi:apolipoprotein N-acyltransferase